MKGVKGIVLYFHPTLFDRRTIPSNKKTDTLAISGIYSSSGYIVVFPDYFGVEEGVHPYVLYPQQNVQSGMAILNQIQGYIKERYAIQNISLFTAGYSEGAAYSLWFKRCISPEYDC